MNLHPAFITKIHRIHPLKKNTYQISTTYPTWHGNGSYFLTISFHSMWKYFFYFRKRTQKFKYAYKRHQRYSRRRGLTQYCFKLALGTCTSRIYVPLLKRKKNLKHDFNFILFREPKRKPPETSENAWKIIY